MPAGLPLANLLAALRSQINRFLSLHSAGARVEIPESLSLAAILQRHYDGLSDEIVRKAARWLAIFGAEPDNFDREAVSAIWGGFLQKADPVLVDLVNRGILKSTFDVDRVRYALHPMIQAFLLSQLIETNEQEDAGQAHARHYLSVLKTAGELFRKGGDDLRRALTIVDQQWLQVRNAWNWLSEHVEGNREAETLRNDYVEFAGPILDLRLNRREFVDWVTSALAAARLLERRMSQVKHLNALGVGHWGLGDKQLAVQLAEESLALARQIARVCDE